MSSVALPSMRWPSKRISPAVLHHAADRAQRGGLAGAVGAEDGGDAARLHREARAPCRTLVQPYWASRSCDLEQGGHQARLAPEVGADHLGIALHLGGRPLGDLPAEVEHHHLVGHLHHQAHVVLDQQHGHAALVADGAQDGRRAPPTSSWFRPPAGSSSSSSLGLPASARASSTRFSVPNGRPAAGMRGDAPRARGSAMQLHRGLAHRRAPRAAPHGRRSALLRKPLRVRQCTPTITFWSTVMRGEQREVLEGAADAERGDVMRGVAA